MKPTDKINLSHVLELTKQLCVSWKEHKKDHIANIKKKFKRNKKITIWNAIDLLLPCAMVMQIKLNDIMFPQFKVKVLTMEVKEWKQRVEYFDEYQARQERLGIFGEPI